MGFGGYFGPCPVNDAAAPLQLSVGPPQPSSPPEPDEWMRRFSTLPLMFQPGERWLYHTGADVLGVLIARASGQPFDAFLRERIFEPLGMNDTAFSVPASDVDRLATSYLTDPETGALELYDAPAGQWSVPPAFPSGGAGLVSTADDYLTFAERDPWGIKDPRIRSLVEQAICSSDSSGISVRYDPVTDTSGKTRSRDRRNRQRHRNRRRGRLRTARQPCLHSRDRRHR